MGYSTEIKSREGKKIMKKRFIQQIKIHKIMTFNQQRYSKMLSVTFVI